MSPCRHDHSLSLDVTDRIPVFSFAWIRNKLTAAQIVRMMGGKNLVIPDEGWTAETFARFGGRMILTMSRIAKVAQRRAIPALARDASDLFNEQLELIFKYVFGTTRAVNRYNTKATIDLMFPQHEQLWAEAIEEVLNETGARAVTRIVPRVQSVMGQSYNRVSILLGQESDARMHPQIARRARDVAARITNVNSTTRTRIMNVVRSSIREGLNVTETAARIRDRVPRIERNRSMTIARTELNNAWNQGTATAFKESSTLTHMSVIGCEAREPNSPQYKGESTCNYPDLPVGEMDSFMEVGFHINHTGTMVPSGFRNRDGSVDERTPEPRPITQWRQTAEDQAE